MPHSLAATLRTRCCAPCFRLLGLALCCCLLSSCLGLQLGKSSLPPPSVPLVGEARQAWDSGDMRKAEGLYEKATKLSGLPLTEQREAWERMAAAAQRNNRPHRAVDALDKWVKADPAADTLPQWQDVWYNSVLTLPPAEAVKQAQAVWRNKRRAPDVRALAGIILTGRSWQPDAVVAALPVLRDSYARQDDMRRRLLEQRASNEVRYTAPSTLTAVNQKAGNAKPLTFPMSVLLLEQARRGLTVPGIATAQIVPSLSAPGVVADPQLISAVLGMAAPKSPPPAPAAVSGSDSTAYGSVCLVLALPATGGTAPIADKIRAGAAAAQTELQKSGANVQVQTVDTSLPDWLAQLEALPPQCVVVGGPLLAPAFSAAKAANTTERRHFFTFLPQLEGGDEGVRGWRFFPSPQDQVEALLRFTKGDLGITSYASYYPSDAYGSRMTGMFEQAVRYNGGTLRASSYVLADTAQWPKAAQSLLATQVVNNVPSPGVSLGAVFLPDSWKNMDQVTNTLRAQGGQNLVLLGTSLWEQSLAGQTGVNTQNYALAVFPGAWNPAQIPAGLATLPGADFWVALGYDFVRFGAAMNLQEYGPAATVNSRAQAAQRLPWAMAPLSWNAQGMAGQQLFLFTPAANGLAPLNVQEFKARLAPARPAQ